ncbi:hypothetical protein [Micromonospora rubida]|uniref:hypothetical protein n=1 Tax=Micromonospora rubida TaxID=2697657 RepID=UPI00137665CA|nr:hypothetical protein [Micromonospora rubida]NBE81249.1 hypothetical protein [Micromonospora rubida]
MLLKTIIVVLVAIAGLAAIIWVANWPFNTMWENELSPEQRRINAAHNRRHHRRAARMMLPIFAIMFGITSVSLLSGPKSDPFAAVVMGACSVVCAGVFGALVKRGRRRRSSTRR